MPGKYPGSFTASGECYGDGAGNTIEQNSSVFSLILMHWLPSVLWHCWLGGRKGIRSVKTWDGWGGHWLVRMAWRPAGWSVCLPLLIFPCTIKSRRSLLAPSHPGGPGKRAVKRLWFYSAWGVVTLTVVTYMKVQLNVVILHGFVVPWMAVSLIIREGAVSKPGLPRALSVDLSSTSVVSVCHQWQSGLGSQGVDFCELLLAWWTASCFCAALKVLLWMWEIFERGVA